MRRSVRLGRFETQLAMMLPLALNAIIGVRIYFDTRVFADHSYLVFGFGLGSFLLTMWMFRQNIVYQSRILLLVIIGYYAGLIKTIDPPAAFSPLGTDIQTLQIGAQMFGLTSIALFGAAAGLLVGGRKLAQPTREWAGIQFSRTSWKALFIVTSILVLITGALSARSYGPSVLAAQYATNEGKGQLLGNLQSIGVMALVLAWIAGTRIDPGKRMKVWLIFLVAYYLGWGIFIRGGRLEVLAGILSLVAIPAAARGKVMGLRWYHYIGVFLLAIVMEAWGGLRSTLSAQDINADTGDSLVMGYKALQEIGVYHAGTISAIASTFANMLDMIHSQLLDYAYGGSYFDYLLRSPPEFLYPNRPPDLAWMFEDYGYQAAGGFFELTEAFMNFSVLGCLIVPFCVSYFLAMFYRKAIAGNFFFFMVFSAMLSVFFRGAWYQTFAYYKAVLTGIVLYLGFWLTAQLFPGKRRRARVDWQPGAQAPDAGAP